MFRTLLILAALFVPGVCFAAPLYSTTFEFTFSWDGESNVPTVTGDPVPNLLHSDNLNINSFGVVFDFDNLQVKNLSVVNESESTQNG